MGNFEKLVVITVLFLSAIVLAFSLGDDSAVEAASPLEEARRQQEETVPGPGKQTAPASTETRKPGLLNSEVTPKATDGPSGSTGADTSTRLSEGESLRPGLTPARERSQPGLDSQEASGRLRILRDATGLETTRLEDFHVYVVKDGDTWNGLARRFYRDTSYLSQLRSANEELTDLVAGERILVPVYDLAQGAGERQPYEPTARREDPAPATRKGGTAKDEYVVQEGDTLSSISLEVYGTANRWEEIYRANQDVLSSPDWLKLGATLKIPPK